MPRSFFPVILALFCLPGAATGRSMSCIYFQAPDGAPAQIHASLLAAESFPLDLPKMELSDAVTIPKGNLTYRLTLEPVAKDQPAPQKSPTVTIPAAWSEVILLFAHDPANAGFPMSVAVLDVSRNSFKPGEMLFFNL